MKNYLLKNAFLIAVPICFLIAGCGINSVTRRQLENIKSGDVLVYRFQKEGKSWFYAEKITRIEGDKIYFNPGRTEATAGNHESLNNFATDKELSISKTELLTYESEQGEQRKVIIWIK
jgi:hypothetical protein